MSPRSDFSKQNMLIKQTVLLKHYLLFGVSKGWERYLSNGFCFFPFKIALSFKPMKSVCH